MLLCLHCNNNNNNNNNNNTYPLLLPQPAQQVNLHMNWSHFKPEYSDKPEDYVEAHLLRTNDWMNTHDFPDGVKFKDFV